MIRFFAGHINAATLLFMTVLILGLSALPNLRRETFPELPPDEVEVMVVYRGASAAEVEEAVCFRLEEAISRVNDVEETRCDAREGVGMATVRMRVEANFDRLLAEVKTEVEGIDSFPREIERPVVRPMGRVDFVASVAVAGPMAPADLKALAEEVKREVLALPEISRVDIKGFSDHQLLIQVSEESLRRLGMSITALAERITAQSLDLPAGSLETGERQILIRHLDSRHTPDSLGRLMVVGSPSGAELRLGEIARITDHFELEEDRILFDGQRAAILEVYKARVQDGLDAVDHLKTLLERRQQQAAPGVVITITRDVTSLVRDRIDMLLENGFQGLVLVLLVMWVFFDLRFGWGVVMGLAISVFGSIFLMGMAGVQINMITLVALLISLGIVMDDTVVIAENIATWSARGHSPLDAAVQGVKEVAPGVVASFLTTILVTIPLVFIEGKMGTILRAFPLILTFTLVMSLIEAFLVFPHHLSHALTHTKARTSPVRRWVDSTFDRLREGFCRQVVDRAIVWRYPVLGMVLSLFLISLALVVGGGLKMRAFPELEGNVMEARLLLPPGSPLGRTEMVVQRLLTALEEVNTHYRPLQPGGASLVQHVAVYYNRNMDAYEQGPHMATVLVDLLDSQVRHAPQEGVIDLWREKTGAPADVLSLKFAKPTHGPAGRPIEIRLMAREMATLETASREVQGWLGEYQGVKDISTDLRPGKPELVLQMRDGALSLGMTAAMVAGQVRAAFQGASAEEIQVGAEAYEVMLRLDDRDRDSVADLEDFHLVTLSGSSVPLSAVARWHEERGYARMHRINGRRTATILGAVEFGKANVKEVLGDFREKYLPALLERHPGLTVEFEGEAKEGSRTGQSIARGFMLGIVGIYLMFALQFGNYREPLVVMAVIPMGLVGAFWGHLVMGLELSMPSLMGLVTLVGVAVNNAILLAEFIREGVNQGMDVASAARQAARQRFRSVFLTTFTTIFGLLPLILERSLQAQVLIPLAVSLGFGLLATTLMALILVPSLYVVLGDGRQSDGKNG